MTPAPTLTTNRLTLRGPQKADAASVAAFYGAPRSRHFGGTLDPRDAWRWFVMSVGHWHWHGYGYWTVTRRGADTPIGLCGIWNPDGWIEPELGFALFDAADEGTGLAYEAALAARTHAYDAMGFATLTSNIAPENTRSIALATRLGATSEGPHENVRHGTQLVYRHPAPERLQ